MASAPFATLLTRRRRESLAWSPKIRPNLGHATRTAERIGGAQGKNKKGGPGNIDCVRGDWEHVPRKSTFSKMCFGGS